MMILLLANVVKENVKIQIIYGVPFKINLNILKKTYICNVI